MKKICLTFLLIITLVFIQIFIFTKPSNNRNWEFGMDKLTNIQINNNLIAASNIREFRYSSNQVSQNYINRTIDASKIQKVWFIVEPFSKYKAIAHTYFVFDFSDQDPLVISVEARREKGEEYSAFLGTFNKYELIYIWGTETDETVRRVVVENNKLYMYPLNISTAGASTLLLQLAKTTQSLETKPRFYNTLFSNCTNELAKAANKVKSNSIPFNIALFLPGYSPEVLYKLGYLPNNIPLDDLNKKYYISDLVRKYYNEKDFSKLLRQQLL